MAAHKIVRRCANYKPSIWSDDYIQSLNSKYKEEVYVKQNSELKEEVRGILNNLTNHVEKLEMIDVLQRLGVSYHFNNEIRNILKNIHNNMDTIKKENLHTIAIAFRLLRQHKFNISADVFASFEDKMGNIKENNFVEVNGLLSLYEASFYSFENEPIMDEARNFTKERLEEFVDTNKDSDTSLLIKHALEFPLQWTIPRMEALWFINFVCDRRRNANVSDVLIQFAELDFNIVQSIHQEDLKNLSRWWKNIGLAEELSFFRDRLVENFVWAMDMNFKPNLGYFREVDAKVNCFITILDDLYDVYGTLEELELFTKAIESWDINDMEGLPHYMKICFLGLYNFVNEVSFVSLKENGSNTIPYLKKAWGDLCKTYFIEATWYYNGYTPRLDEYMENAWISVAVHVGLTHVLFFTPPLKMEDLDLSEEYPSIVRSSATICRLADDLGTLKREMVTGDVSKASQCYMNETGASEAEAHEHLRGMMLKVWKKMNEEAFNSSLSEDFIYAAVNIGRAALLYYQHGDGFTVSHHQTKNRIKSLIMQPLSVLSK